MGTLPQAPLFFRNIATIFLEALNCGYVAAGVFFLQKNKYDTSVDPKQQVYFEIKKPPWVSVVWVVIACCICSKHDPCICNKKCNITLSASNALVAAKSCERSCHHWNRQEQAGEKIICNTKRLWRSERSERSFYSNETIFDGASEASGVLLAINTKVWRSERSERIFFYLQ